MATSEKKASRGKARTSAYKRNLDSSVVIEYYIKSQKGRGTALPAAESDRNRGLRLYPYATAL